jgi:uncharacterized protein (TIGR02217 family)
MAFYEIQFPATISFGAQGGPGYRTDVVVVSSGAETRNVTWAQARRRYDVSFAARLPTAADAVKAFFHNMQGRAHGFRFKDWTDYSATASEGKFTLLTSTTFQAYKRYTSSGQTYDRIIQKGIATWSITGGAGVSIDYNTGIVSVSSGTPTAWAGQFDVPCRFDTDELTGTILDKSGAEFIIGWDSIPIVEIRIA